MTPSPRLSVAGHLRSTFRASVRALVAHRVLIAILLVALGLRLWHNLVFHKPEDFIWSDMKGYFDRSKGVFTEPMKKSPWATFFPYGTHVFIAALIKLFGTEKKTVGVAFALVGTAVVWAAYGIARELHAVVTRRVPGAPLSKMPALATAAAAAVWYPQIGFGGYMLSETPFALCLSAAVYFSLRVASTGLARHAWALGLWLALGLATRSQILLSIAALVPFWLFCVARGADLGRFRLGHWVRAAVPVALVLAFSIARVKHHTGHWGLVSTNGPLNAAFGRCHAQTISTNNKGEKAMFGPPPFHFLAENEKKNPKAFARLAPVLDREMQLKGRMWESATFDGVLRECVEKSGWLGQAHFMSLHVAMLWAWNGTWPDSAVPQTRKRMHAWATGAPFFLVPSSVFALVLALRKRTARFGLVAMHLVALAVVAALYFGDTRLRTPYDAVVLAAGFPMLFAGAKRLRAHIRRRTLRGA